MRITNNFIQNNALAQLQSNLKQISGAQQKVSTGLRMQKASDDPTGAGRTMQARGSLRALEQYRRNIDQATSRADMEEAVLQQVDSLLSRAKELGISQGTAGAGPETRAAAKAEVDVLLQQMISLGNTKLGEEYLFGAQWSDAAPFDAAQTTKSPAFTSLDPDTGLPRLPSGGPQTEIANGRYLQAHHDGQQVFLDSGVLDALRQLSEALADPDDPQAAIGKAISSIDQAFHEVGTLVGETGARMNQLQVTGANLDALEINLTTLKSNLEDVDLEKAVSDLVSRQTSFQAAMLATSRVMGLTLTDYLR